MRSILHSLAGIAASLLFAAGAVLFMRYIFPLALHDAGALALTIIIWMAVFIIVHMSEEKKISFLDVDLQVRP